MWSCNVETVIPNISKDLSKCIFKIRQTKRNHSYCTAWPWEWSPCDPSKHWELFIQWHSITYQTTCIFSDSPRFTGQKLPSTTSCQPRKWRQHVPPKHWQHCPLSLGVNTPKHNQQKQKQTLYMCLVTLKARILETKSDSFQEKYSAYKQKSKNCLALMLCMCINICAHTHTHTHHTWKHIITVLCLEINYSVHNICCRPGRWYAVSYIC